GMKRLVAAGASAIYQITRAFRGGERGPLHNPEFTMVEWYRVGDDYERGMRLLGELASDVLGCDEVQRITYREAFQGYAGIDPFGSLDGLTLPSALPAGADREVILDYVHTTCVEPQLGRERPTIL